MDLGLCEVSIVATKMSHIVSSYFIPSSRQFHLRLGTYQAIFFSPMIMQISIPGLILAASLAGQTAARGIKQIIDSISDLKESARRLMQDKSTIVPNGVFTLGNDQIVLTTAYLPLPN